MIPSGQGCRGGMDMSIVKIIVFFLRQIIAFILHGGFMVIIKFSSN